MLVRLILIITREPRASSIEESYHLVTSGCCALVLELLTIHLETLNRAAPARGANLLVESLALRTREKTTGKHDPDPCAAV